MHMRDVLKCNAFINACTVCSFNRLFLVISRRMLIVSCALVYDDAIRACAVSTVTAGALTGQERLFYLHTAYSLSLFY